MGKTSSKSVLSNLIWRFMERFGAEMVQFVVSIVLARILEPTHYGTVALMNVFITILTVFVKSGFNSALIQKKNADDLDFSTVFYAQAVLCLVLYSILFFAAPFIARFYNDLSMTPMIRVLGLTLLIAGVKNIQIAYVSRHMQFKRFFFATLGGTLGAAGVGIALALLGFGVWALIAQSLFNNTVDTLILWVTVKWRPTRQFSFSRLMGDPAPKVERVDWKKVTKIRKRNITSQVMLSLLTLGIYRYYWYYLLVKNVRAIRKDKSGCAKEMLCLIFVPFYALYWWHTRVKAVHEKFAENGDTARANGTACVLFSLFGLDLVALGLLQRDFNALPVKNRQERQQGLFSFGWKLLVSSLIDKLSTRIRSLIIGKVYSKADLAYYNRGSSWPSLVIDNVNTSIDSVLLPTMSREQDDREHVKAITRRSIKTSTYIMAPLLMGLAGCSISLIRLILTAKWLPAVPYQMIFCVTAMFHPIHTANLNAIKAMGRSDLNLKLQIIKSAFGLTVLFITVRISVMALALSALVTCLFGQIVNSWPNRKLLDYHVLEQWKDILPNILLAMFMGGVVYCVSFLGLNDWLTLAIQVPLGVGVYLGGSVLFKLESFHYVLGMVKSILQKRKKKSESK